MVEYLHEHPQDWLPGIGMAGVDTVEEGPADVTQGYFRMELAMASECTRRPDLKEGIRALAIDKDRNPRWSCERIADVPEEVVAAHFVPEWNDETDPMRLE